MTLIEQLEKRQVPREPRERRLRIEDVPLAARDDGMRLVLPMAMVHCVLDALVRFQYQQQVSLWLVFKGSVAAIPVYYGLFKYVHPHCARPASQALLAAFSVGTTSYLIHIANREGYYAVMYKAPPLGTLSVWTFIELDLRWSLITLGGVGVFLWWSGYHL